MKRCHILSNLICIIRYNDLLINSMIMALLIIGNLDRVFFRTERIIQVIVWQNQLLTTISIKKHSKGILVGIYGNNK
ncbi:MAG: hypothetical protein JSC188_000575 [Candidatus Tokpelaia sp. JSC188]|nr:MAG: hypothetical protein JSC188_000575 [Candidatus Tokpelaia sp. JSC188]